ncbi:MAG TPA: hypothetical protein VFV89_17245 [Nocardioides sp.]|nr:hypothetical protein [Nocardioides sp.]
MSVQSTTKPPEDPQDHEARSGLLPRSQPAPIPSSQARPPQLAWDPVERRHLSRRLGQLLDGTANPRFQASWDMASAESFRPWSAAERAAAAQRSSPTSPAQVS